MAEPADDDLMLARRVTSGDETAFRTLYSQYAEPLYAFVCHRLQGVRTETDDIWQETLLAAINSLPTYQGQSGLFAWLCGIACHKIADYLRRKGREPVVFSEVPAKELSVIIDHEPLPDEMLTQPDVRIRVVNALTALPETYRLALAARYADQRSVDELARSLGKTYKATESLLARARAAFREALLQEDEKVLHE